MKKRLILLILLLSFPFMVKAESFNIESSASKTYIYPEDTVTITVKLKDLVDFKKGINAYSATLDYDDNLFEKVTSSDFQSLGNWIEFDYNPANKKLIAYSKVRILDKTDVLKLNLKVKKDALPNTTNISFSYFTVSEGEKDVINNSRTVVEIVKKQPTTPKEYYYLEGANLVYTPDKDNVARFKVNSDFSLFKDNGKVYVDNNLVDRRNYVAKSGSTIIELTKDYLNTLKAGDHKLSIVLSDNTRIDTIFTINKVTNTDVRVDENVVIENYVSTTTVQPTTKKSVKQTTKKVAVTTNNIEPATTSRTTTTRSTTTSTRTITTKEVERTFVDEEKEINSSRRIWIIVIIIIIIVLLLAVIKYLKDKNSNNSLINRSLVILIGLLTLTAGLNVRALTLKGEVNGDGEINEIDVILIKKFIVGLGSIANEYLENADMNSDNKVTVTDLSLVLTKSLEKIDYTVEINEIKTNGTLSLVNKGETIILSINASTVNDSVIEKFVIDGNEYNAVLENGIYKVEIPSIATPGFKTIKIESAILNIGKTIKIDFEKQIEVLKNLPTISDYSYVEKDDSEFAEISFYVNDDDNSFKSGILKITDSSNKEIESIDVSKGYNYLTFNPVENGRYTVNLVVSANRYTSTTKLEEVKLTKEFNYNVDYQAELDNISIFNKNNLNEPISSATIDDELVVSFDFRNAFGVGIDRFTINGKIYNVVEGNGYNKISVNLSNQLTVGKNTFTISDIVLKNGYKLNLSREIEINVTYRKPRLSLLESNEFDSYLRTAVNITDVDNQTNNNVLKILNDQNEVLLSKDFDANKDQVFDLDLNEIITSKFVIEVYANYDGELHLLETRDKSANPKVKVISSETQKELIDKNESVGLTYHLKINNSDIKSLIIDNIEIPITNSNIISSSNNEIILSVNASGVDLAGLHKFNLQVIKIGNSLINLNHETPIYVKKSIPTIALDEVVSNNDDNDVIFKFNIYDDDNAFVSAKISLYSDDDVNYSNVLMSDEIGNSKVKEKTFTLEENKKYRYKIDVNYERDPRAESLRTDDTKGVETLVKSYTLVRNYTLNITNVKITDSNYNEVSNIEKNTQTLFMFNMSYARNKDIESVKINDVVYPIFKYNSSYYARLPLMDLTKKYTYHLQSIYLNDGSVLDVDTLLDNSITKSVTVLKSAPIVDTFEVVEINDVIKTTININDESGASVSNTLKVYDANNNELFSEDFNPNNNNVIDYSIPEDLMTSKYIVKLFSKYSLGEEESTTVELGTKVINASPRARIINAITDRSIVDKNSPIIIKYSIVTNYGDVTRLVINENELNVSKDSNNDYSVSVNAIDVSGKNTYNLTKVFIGDKEINVNHELFVYSKRDKPSITSITAEDNIVGEKISVSINFEVNDNDNSFTSGVVEVFNSSDTNYQNPISSFDYDHNGKNTITALLERDKPYKFRIKANYDLDSRPQGEKENDFIDSVTELFEYRFVSGYELTVSNVKLTNSSNQEVSIIEKNAPIRIYVETTNNANLDASKITINDQQYDLVKYSNGYYAEISENSAGVKTYRITSIVLSNMKDLEIDTPIEKTVTVLKEVPTITGINVTYISETEDFFGSDIIVNYAVVTPKFNDPDGAITNIKYSYMMSEELGWEVENSNINMSDLPLKFYAYEGYVGKVVFFGEYNLISSDSTDSNYIYTFGPMEKSIEYIPDYEVDIINLKTYKVIDANTNNPKKGTESNSFEKGEPIFVDMDIKNSAGYSVTYIRINGNDCFAIESEDYGYTVNPDEYMHYSTMLISGLTGGSKLTIESLDFMGVSTVTINDVSIPITITKLKPSVTDMYIEEDVDGGKVNAQFNIMDEDNVISYDSNNNLLNAKVKLFDSSGNVISESVIGQLDKSEDSETDVVVSLNSVLSPSYTLRVYVSYDLDDGNGIQGEQIIYESTISAKANAIINSIETSNQYPSKNENITLTYNLITNKNIDIKNVVVDGETYTVNKSTDNGVVKYSINVSSGNTPGVKTLVTEKFTFSDDSFVTVYDTDSATVNVDVLKDKPSVEDYNISIKSSTKALVTFNLADKDDSFSSGRIELMLDGNKVNEKNISKNENSIELDVIEGKKYTFNVLANYDLDSNTFASDLNQGIDDLIYTENIQVLSDYHLTVSNIKTYNEEKETKYFEKGENILLEFNSTNATDDFYPVKATINGKVYDLTNKDNDTYTASLKGILDDQVYDINITKIELNNKIVLDTNETKRIEILKQKPLVEKFKYEESTSSITASFNIVDDDKAIKNGYVIVRDASNNEIKRSSISSNDNSVNISFSKRTTDAYYITLEATYDLDTNSIETGKNEYSNKVILSDSIVNVNKAIEFKDIKEVQVYKEETSGVIELSEINVNDIKSNKSKYLVKVNMKDLNSFYATVSDVIVNENENVLDLKLSYNNVVQYKGEVMNKELIVTYGVLSDDKTIARGSSFNVLINNIRENMSGNFTLTQDLDANDLISNVGSYIVSGTFNGTINGNGYTIKNLTKPLFENLGSGAVIENLVLEDARITNGRGLIANQTTANEVSIIRNVHIKNLTMRTTSNESGSFVGTLRAGSRIESSSATNINITGGNKRTGGLVGAMGGSTIANSYASGTLNCTNDGIGGIAGSSEGGSRIENVIVKINFNVTSGPGYNGAIVGHPMNITVRNALSLSSGKGVYKIYGVNSLNNQSANLYSIENGFKTYGREVVVEDHAINKELLTSIGFENVWNLNNVSFDRLPTVGNIDPNAKENVIKPNTNGIYIPDYERLKEFDEYNDLKEIAYANMYKLMPYYDAKYLVAEGNRIPLNNELNRKIIVDVLPFNAAKNLVKYLSTENNNYQDINSIKIVFSDGSTSNYNVTFKKYHDNIVSYIVDDLFITYNFNRYVIKHDSSVIDTLLSYAEGLTYEDLATSVNNGQMSELYSLNYDSNIRNNLKTFLLEYLDNDPTYTVTMNNNILNAILVKDLKTNKKLNQILYAHNYYDRWYNVKILDRFVTQDKVVVRDLIEYYGSLYSNTMTTSKVMDEVIAGVNTQTSRTGSFFQNNLAKYMVHSNIGEFLDYNVKTIGNYYDQNDWFTEEYPGLIYEVFVEDKPEIQYRAWYHIKRRKQEWILPLLTIPKYSGYIVSYPTQFMVGSSLSYIDDPTDPVKRERLMDIMKGHANAVIRMYTVVSGFVDADRMNSVSHCHYDTQKTTFGDQRFEGQYTKRDPYYTHFNLATDVKGANNGSYAYAGGADVGWNIGFALTNTKVWTHESAHNQDSVLYMKGYGRRAGGEHYADGNLSQEFYEGSMNWNLMFTYSYDSTATVNFVPESINTQAKLDRYYNNMYSSVHLLDYIEAKAVLQLTQEQKYKVLSQVSYNGVANNDDGGEDIRVGRLAFTNGQGLKTKLETIDDLIADRIVMFQGVDATQMYNNSGYNYRTIWDRNFYQMHNDNGKTNNAWMKQTAWAMFGDYGYEGYLTWYSGKSKNDLDAIRKVTNNPAMTYQIWKSQKYKDIASKIDTFTYFDVETAIEQYKEALIKDGNSGVSLTNSTNLRKYYFHFLKRASNDFTNSIYNSEVTHIRNAKEFVDLINASKEDNSGRVSHGYYVLDGDINLSGYGDDKAIISGTFTGKIDGNGYKITGLSKPLFDKVRYSYISNVRFSNESINTSVIAPTGNTLTLYNVTSDIESNNKLFFNSSSGVITVEKN